MAFKTLKNIFAGAFMLVTLWSVLATSQPQKSIEQGTFYVVSDCVSPVLENQVTTSGGQIVTPLGQSYIDFGFPQTFVSLQGSVTGPIFGVNRNCILSYGDKKNGDGWIYSCYDNNTFKCTIVIRPM